MMRSFIAALYLESPSLFNPMTTLDAIILGEMMRFMDGEEAIRRLPLAKTDGVPHASVGYFDHGRARVEFSRVAMRGKDLEDAPVHQFRGKMGSSTDSKFGNTLNHGYEGKLLSVMRFAGVGVLSEVDEWLDNVMAIGSQRAVGMGAVRDFLIAEVDQPAQSWGLTHPEIGAMRPVPVPMWQSSGRNAPPPLPQMVRARPFYWDARNEPEPCAIPVVQSTAVLEAVL